MKTLLSQIVPVTGGFAYEIYERWILQDVDFTQPGNVPYATETDAQAAADLFLDEQAMQTEEPAPVIFEMYP